MKKNEKNQKNVATIVARFAAGDSLNGAMRNIARTATALLVVFTILYLNVFAMCAKDEDPEPQTAEFSIKVRQSDEWTPFRGDNGVTFSNSNSSVISVSDNGTTVTFTGIKAGNSTITAKHNNQVATAIVTVTDDNGGGEDNPGEPTDPPPPPPSEQKVFIVDAFYSGALNGEINQIGPRLRTITQGVAFAYKMKIEVFKGIWLDLKNGKLPHLENEYFPIMQAVFDVGSDGEDIYNQDGYIDASYYNHSVQGKESSTTRAEVECFNSENDIRMTMYYHKKKNQYRMEIEGGISSTTCPYAGTTVYVSEDGTTVDPYISEISFHDFGPWETNIDNDGDIYPYSNKFLDVPKEWIEEFMANPEKEQLLLHFDWVGGSETSWPGLGTYKEVKTMKATFDLGND